MTVVGVDPGLTATGYAVLEAPTRTGDGPWRVCDSGCIRSNRGQPVEIRLDGIHGELDEVLARWRPMLMVLEGLYTEYGFPRTAILMGHVRGVICLAAAHNEIRVLEIAPAEMKKALTGSGRAGKDQIRRAVTRMLGLKKSPSSEHVCDAMALAVVGALREGAAL